MSTMSYKGYAARVEFDDEDGIFFGRISGIPTPTKPLPILRPVRREAAARRS